MKSYNLIGTPLTATNYQEFREFLYVRSVSSPTCAVDFTNTHIVTLRRHSDTFRAITDPMDFFIPDGMPLIWCLNAKGAKLRDRVYGPTFFRECLAHSPTNVRHFFLGGSDECLMALVEVVKKFNPNLTIAGVRNGYFQLEDEVAIFDSIKQSGADMIWVGMGTPKQQAWINRWKLRFDRGVLLAVGFAFDVNAGTKPDAPFWMQKFGLTWIFRIYSEPRRLLGRYLKYNSLFIFYLLKERLLKR